MTERLSEKDRQQITAGIRGKYRKVANSPTGLFQYPTGRAGLDRLGYDPAWVGMLPETVADAFCGVGNPFSLATVSQGAVVVDVGCGAGVDTLLAALMTGPHGLVVGVDLVEEMVRRAQDNLARSAVTNAHFLEASAEALPFAEQSVDVIISNGVFNLVADKNRALAELFRILRPGGRLMMADQMLIGSPGSDRQTRIENWFR